MVRERVLVIDGSASPASGSARSDAMEPIRRTLLDLLAERDAETRLVTPDPDRQAHCIGCFHCWVEEPGICRYHDGGADILAAIAACDTLVLLSPLTFGGYSAALKQIIDRMLGLLLPDFVVTGGELAHPWRYLRAPRLIGIAICDRRDQAEIATFRALVGRTARNMRATTHASTVVMADELPTVRRAAIDAALSRAEPIPSLADIEHLAPTIRADGFAAATAAGHALLLIGSPRQLSPSTSTVLATRLGRGLCARGWTSETLVLRDVIRRAEGRTRLLDAVARSDLLVLCFPLYWDTPPYVLIRGLEILSMAMVPDAGPKMRRLAVIVNSSFVQATQSSLALAICARFAESVGFEWAGALALGSGAWIDGKPLTGPHRSIRPVGHVIRALDGAAAALAAGRPVPAEATVDMARTPIRLLPTAAWQRLYASVTGRELRRRASRNGIGATAYLAGPYMTSPR